MATVGTGLLDRGLEDEVLRASRISRYSISSPPVVVSALVAAALATLTFLVLLAGPTNLTWHQAATLAAFGLLAPAWLAATAAYHFFRETGGTITRARCAMLAAVDMAIILVFTVVGAVVPWRAPDVWVWALLSGTAFACSVNMLVFAATSNPRLSMATVPSLVLPAGALSVLTALDSIDARQALLGAYFVVIFLAGATLWATIVVAPFKRNFGEKGLVLLHALLDVWAGWSKEPGSAAPARGTVAMEAFFSRHGQPREVGFQAASFRREGGSDVLWFVPDLHPGPYADLGGSDLPSKVAQALPGKAVSTFHGASTHDENPCRREDLAKVTAALDAAVAQAEQDATASPSRRFSHGAVTLLAQSLGGHLVLVHTRAPASSDDIDQAAGRAVVRAIGAQGGAGVALLDAHNCVGKDLGRTLDGSAEHAELQEAALRAARELTGEELGAFHVGSAQRVLSPDKAQTFAVGRQGIQATVVAVGEQKTAYVLIDGNNLKAGLRQAMLEAVEGAVDDAEVLTTDNHAVNKTMGADDEVGSRGDNTPLVDEVAAAVKEAADDLRPSSVAWASGSVSDVRVFGPGLTVKMSATINSAVSVMIPTYIACMCAALLGCGLLALVGV